MMPYCVRSGSCEKEDQISESVTGSENGLHREGKWIVPSLEVQVAIEWAHLGGD